MVLNNSTNQNTVNNSIKTQSASPFQTALGSGALNVNTGLDNTAVGYNALTSNLTGVDNTAVGYLALDACTTGYSNTAIGSNAGGAIVGGYENVIIGQNALAAGTSANRNVAIGFEAGKTCAANASFCVLIGEQAAMSNAGSEIVAIGGYCMKNGTGITDSCAVGYTAMQNCVSGDQNTAFGHQAMIYNVTGSRNTAVGQNAWQGVTGQSASDVVAIGYQSAFKNRVNETTAVGSQSLNAITTGATGCCAMGFKSATDITTGTNNTAIGHSSLFAATTGANNTCLGYQSGYSLATGDSNNICIGSGVTGTAGDNTTTRIGVQGTQTKCFIAGINGVTTGLTANPVFVDANGQLGTGNSLLQFTTGWATWGGSGNYFDDTTLGSFTILRPGSGYINGKLVSWTAPQTTTGLTAGNTYFIYIDSTGTIGSTATRTDALFQNNIVLFECLRDSTPVTNNQITVKENHPFGFEVQASNYLHDNIGCIIENINNGANITLNGTQGIQINGADVLSDHGLETDIPDSLSTAVTWRKLYTVGGKWATQNNTNTFTGFYNNGGTPTALSPGFFAVYRLYVTKDNLTSTTPTYFAVLDTQQYNTIGLAQAAITNDTAAKATNELSALEIAQLGLIIYRQSTSAIVQVTIAKSTLKQTISTAGSNQASLINVVTTNFNGVLSATDSNVQTALETIDEYRGGLYPVLATANITMASNRCYIVKNATPALQTLLTLPATAIQGDVICVTGYTAGGWLIGQNANQTIYFGTSQTTVGVGGSIASGSSKDVVRIICVTAGSSTEWSVQSSVGLLTVT